MGKNDAVYLNILKKDVEDYKNGKIIDKESLANMFIQTIKEWDDSNNEEIGGV